MFTLRLGNDLFYEFDIFEGDGLIPNEHIYMRRTNITTKEQMVPYMDTLIRFIAEICKNNKIYYNSHKNIIKPFDAKECEVIEEKVRDFIKNM